MFTAGSAGNTSASICCECAAISDRVDDLERVTGGERRTDMNVKQQYYKSTDL
ncbi:unnamed protein product, partial [Trichogramma brassicae]